MIALKIKNQKNFMTKLLATELFDDFLAEEATIETYNTFSIDGRIHKDFYKDAADLELEVPSEEFSKWGKLRPICLELIKGKQTPLSFKFILHLSGSKKDALISGIDSGFAPSDISLGINIKFSSGVVVITTGVSYSIFTMDKDAEKAWDNYIPSFLESNGIEAELL